MGSSSLSACVDQDLFAGRNLFVVGDVHLHAGSEDALGLDLERLARDITARDPLSCIVFNGDVFDLDRVGSDPAFGIGDGTAARRLDQVLDAFEGLTQALSVHVAGGGAMVFVAGNHDAELLLPSVEQQLQHRIAGADPGVRARVQAAESIALPHVRIEHGHQLDPDSIFYPDMHTAVRKNRLSAFPLASLFTRFFLSRTPRYEALGDNYKTPLPVLMRVLCEYRLAALAMIARYPVSGLRVCWQSVLARLRCDVPRYQRTPVVSMSSPIRVARRLYLDRYFGVVVGSVLALCIGAGLLPNRAWWAIAVIAVYLAIPPLRMLSFHDRDARRCADRATQHTADGARLVVFGHIHQAFVTRLGEAIYANHGAFSMPVEIDELGNVCTQGSSRGRRQRRRRARPYLSITTEPLACDGEVLQ